MVQLDAVQYIVHLGSEDVLLPTIEHLPEYTDSVELQYGTLTLADSSVTEIGAGETDKLEDLGVSLKSNETNAWLQVNVDDDAYYLSKLDLSIKSFVKEEPDFFNTTRVQIQLNKPPCGVSQEDLDLTLANVLTISGQ